MTDRERFKTYTAEDCPTCTPSPETTCQRPHHLLLAGETCPTCKAKPSTAGAFEEAANNYFSTLNDLFTYNATTQQYDAARTAVLSAHAAAVAEAVERCAVIADEHKCGPACRDRGMGTNCEHAIAAAIRASKGAERG